MLCICLIIYAHIWKDFTTEIWLLDTARFNILVFLTLHKSEYTVNSLKKKSISALFVE